MTLLLVMNSTMYLQFVSSPRTVKSPGAEVMGNQIPAPKHREPTEADKHNLDPA